MIRTLVLGAVTACTLVSAAEAQTAILVRHAEKADQSQDPVLSSAGQDRAVALAVALSGADLTHVFVTPLQRTAMTAQPTAEAHAVTPQVIGFDGGTDVHITVVAQAVRALPDDAVVLVVGHSNTIPLIARALGETGPSEMADCEYDRLTIIHVEDDGDSPAVIGRYGLPSTCE